MSHTRMKLYDRLGRAPTDEEVADERARAIDKALERWKQKDESAKRPAPGTSKG